MSKDKDKKITGGWAFLNNPDPPAGVEAEALEKSPRTRAITPEQWAKARAWLKKRRWFVLAGSAIVVLACVGLWFAFIREPGPLEDRVAIQGEWRITKQGGTPGQDEGQMTVRIDGDRWTYVVGGRDVTTWRFEINPEADPREIELTLIERDGQPIQVKGPVPKQLGVYTVTRKTLQVALAPEHNGRPKGLDDPDAPALMLTKAK